MHGDFEYKRFLDLIAIILIGKGFLEILVVCAYPFSVLANDDLSCFRSVSTRKFFQLNSPIGLVLARLITFFVSSVIVKLYSD